MRRSPSSPATSESDLADRRTDDTIQHLDPASAMVWKRRNSGAGAGGSPGRGAGADEAEEKVPRGHVPMVAGGERVLVPVTLLSDPCVAELLDMAAQRYGYGQPGVLRVPCDAGRLRRVVDGAMQRCGITAPA